MSDTFNMQTCGPYGLTLKCIPTGSFRGHSLAGWWREGLNGGSSCRVVPLLECGC